MRISTAALHASAIADILKQQASLAKTQDQLATGSRVNSPSDDPVAAVQIQELERLQQESTQFGQNSDAAKNRLSLEEQALSDATTAMQRVRELTVEASNTATLSDSDRQSIATEIDGLKQDMLDIANRKDSNGEYLFSGFSSQTQPFAQNSLGSVQYAGDQSARSLQISSSQQMQDSDTGYDVFMNIVQGNGTFVTTPAAVNTGSAVVGVGTVTNRSAWTPGTFTLNFTSATDYQIVDSTNTVVSTGAYASGSSIAFNGVQFTLAGAPATGDSFTIAPAGKQDIFTTLDNLSAALSAPVTTASQRANLTSTMGAILSQVDQTVDHMTTASGSVGSRLNALDIADSARSDFSLQTQTSLGNVRDVDYASAVSKMNQQLLGLQAAQASYAKISQLSLFDYL